MGVDHAIAPGQEEHRRFTRGRKAADEREGERRRGGFGRRGRRQGRRRQRRLGQHEPGVLRKERAGVLGLDHPTRGRPGLGASGPRALVRLASQPVLVGGLPRRRRVEVVCSFGSWPVEDSALGEESQRRCAGERKTQPQAQPPPPARCRKQQRGRRVRRRVVQRFELRLGRRQHLGRGFGQHLGQSSLAAHGALRVKMVIRICASTSPSLIALRSSTSSLSATAGMLASVASMKARITG